MRRRVLLAPFCLAVACSSTDNGTVQILITDPATFTGPPAVTTLTVLAQNTNGGAPTTLVANAPLSATAIDLGSQNENSVDSIQVTGAGANGGELVAGSTLPFPLGELAGLSLPVFVQRLGQLVPLPSVAPAPQPDARQAPVVAQFEQQYLFVGGGSDASLSPTSELYDFLQFALLPQPPALVTATNAPLAPVSVAFVGTVALLVDQNGAATYFDFSGTSPPTAVMPPVGGSTFGDVAGGATVIADDGTEFIVGATRTTGIATSSVLEINPNDMCGGSCPNGNLAWLSLSANRLGASAAWVSGFGLVVTGGSATANGAELLGLPSSTSTSATTTPTVANGRALPYSPDPSVGTGAVLLQGSTVLLAGGVTGLAGGAIGFQDAGVRTIDVGCTSAPCTVTTWVPALPEPIWSAQAFALNPALNPASAFLVGNEPFAGTTHAFLLSPTAATEVKTAVTHKNATATLSPVGSIVVVGGANDIESFLPSVTAP